MRYTTLKGMGATQTKPLDYYADRQKSHGCMWGGEASLELNGVVFHFQLWHHGGDTLTKEQAEQEISLKGVKMDGAYYDAYWHTFMTEDAIWLHKEGWFGCNKELENNRVVRMRRNYNFDRNEEADEGELTRLGFVKVVGR
jgi:hypothetical protein